MSVSAAKRSSFSQATAISPRKSRKRATAAASSLGESLWISP